MPTVDALSSCGCAIRLTSAPLRVLLIPHVEYLQRLRVGVLGDRSPCDEKGGLDVVPLHIPLVTVRGFSGLMAQFQSMHLSTLDQTCGHSAREGTEPVISLCEQNVSADKQTM